MTTAKRIENIEKNLNTAIEKREIEKLGGQLFYNENTKRQEVIFSVFSNSEKLTAQEKRKAEQLEMICKKYGYHFDCLHFIDDVPEEDNEI